jgi:HPt (histidine-containing phosphotransfer) domain-containing protein
VQGRDPQEHVPKVDLERVDQRPDDVPEGQLPGGADGVGTLLFTPELPSTPELDQSIVNDLLELGGAELMGELATMSCAEIMRSTADLDLELSQGNAGAAARTAHALAGVSACIGATGLAAVARALERLAADGELGSARALRVELAERSLRVRQALAVYATGALAGAKGDEACVATRTARA